MVRVSLMLRENFGGITMKKLISLMLTFIMLLAIPCTTFAAEEECYDVEDITVFIGDDGLEYEYIRYSDPVTYEYDGTTHTLLGTIQRKQDDNGITTYDYREWTTWSVIDYGIVEKWVDMSDPFFVKSIARGETYEDSIEKTVTISAKAGINIPSGSQSTVNTALKGEFSLGLTGSYSRKITITLSGPTDANTRTFYYKKGYHKHNITIIEELRSNWDGLIRETPHENCYGYEPAVRSYSEDENIQ